MRRQQLPSLRRTHVPWLILGLALALAVAPARAQKIDTPIAVGDLPSPHVMLEVKQFGGDFTQWIRNWSEADPQVVTFRWSTQLAKAGSAEWQVLRDGVVIARGPAGSAPAAGTYRQFTVDFRPIAGVEKKRPLVYWVRVAVAGRDRVKGTPPPPALGAPVKVSFVGSGPVTQFTFTGLRPELLHKLPVAIDLQTLAGTGGDGFEPFLIVVVVYADGTTIVPTLNLGAQRIEFPGSSVRIAHAASTHGNLLGDDAMDGGETIAVPPETGHYETTLTPIGVQLARDIGMSSAQQRSLRERSVLGILVIGLEEGSQPSTEAMDSLRDGLVSTLQAELDGIVRGITVPFSNPSKVPSILDAVQQVIGTIRKQLQDSAKAKTMDEIWSYLKLPGGPVLSAFAALDALANHDEYVGTSVKVLSYQQLLDAGESGIPLDFTLSGSDSNLVYQVHGRARVR